MFVMPLLLSSLFLCGHELRQNKLCLSLSVFPRLSSNQTKQALGTVHPNAYGAGTRGERRCVRAPRLHQPHGGGAMVVGCEGVGDEESAPRL